MPLFTFICYNSFKFHKIYRLIWDTLDLRIKVGYICQFPQKDIGCIIEGDASSNYNGTVDKSENGHPCIRWDTIYRKENGNNALFQTVGLTENDDIDQKKWAHNYCRNPGGEDPSPFCFINAVDIEYCDIPSCRERKVTS